MKPGYTILHCKGVPTTVDHYERTFDLSGSFMRKSNLHAEMETAETTLAFASHDMAETSNIAIQPNDQRQVPSRFEIVLIDDDIPAASKHALANGAIAVTSPETMSCRQVVAYVRDMDSCLVELATPMSEREGSEAG